MNWCKLERWSKRTLLIIFFLGSLNAVAFEVAADRIGGYAAVGKIVDGRYYLQNREGEYQEVGKTAYRYSEWHGYIIGLNTALALTAALVCRSVAARCRKERRLTLRIAKSGIIADRKQIPPEALARVVLTAHAEDREIRVEEVYDPDDPPPAAVGLYEVLVTRQIPFYTNRPKWRLRKSPRAV